MILFVNFVELPIADFIASMFFASLFLVFFHAITETIEATDFLTNPHIDYASTIHIL